MRHFSRLSHAFEADSVLQVHSRLTHSYYLKHTRDASYCRCSYQLLSPGIWGDMSEPQQRWPSDLYLINVEDIVVFLIWAVFNSYNYLKCPFRLNLQWQTIISIHCIGLSMSVFIDIKLLTGMYTYNHRSQEKLPI